MLHLRLVLNVMLAIPVIGFSQSPKTISDAELEVYQSEIAAKARMLWQELEGKDYLTDFEKEVSVAFKVDTFKINQLLAWRVEVDYSTVGMVKAIYDAEAEYDKLLNKYYQQLMTRLNDSDKATVKQAQRNWIAFRDSERLVNREVAKEEYSGGGTIQGVMVAERHLELTRMRVHELYAYLLRFNQ